MTCYCECVNDAGGKFHPFLVCAWTEGSSLLLFMSLFFLIFLMVILYFTSQCKHFSEYLTILIKILQTLPPKKLTFWHGTGV